MQDPVNHKEERHCADASSFMRMPPSTARTRSASPGAALLATTPGAAMAMHRNAAVTQQQLRNQHQGFDAMDRLQSSTVPRAAEGALRSPSAPPSVGSVLPRNAVPSAASRGARSHVPSATTPRRCEGDAGDVQPSLGPEYYASENDNPWLAAQMNFRGRRMFADENACKSDIGAASISSLKKCIAQAQCLPEQQKPNSEKWTGRWSGMQVQNKEM